MFFDYPLFGVGLQGYAFALPKYADLFMQQNFDWSFRRIANNIYVELLSEEGLIGVFAMGLLLFQICKKSLFNFRKSAIISSGLLAIMMSWLAFPTYTVSFHWLGFAIFYRLAMICIQKSKYSVDAIDYRLSGVKLN
jgi:O-antigen ligase